MLQRPIYDISPREEREIMSTYQPPHYEKSNDHYVPQHWQRRFRDANNQLWVREGSLIEIRGTRSTMTDRDTYTSFNKRFEPSDAIEDALSVEEGRQSLFIDKIIVPGYLPTDDDLVHLCNVLALQAVRHPDVMTRSRRLAMDSAATAALVHEMTKSEFVDRFKSRRASQEFLGKVYDAWLQQPQHELIAQATDIEALSPQDAQLPEVYALSAWTDVFLDYITYQVEILDAPVGYSFVLSDTPMPQWNARGGFTVPLSLSVAVVAHLDAAKEPSIVRKTAKPFEVWAVNQEQWNRHKLIVVGDKQVLAKLMTENDMPANY
jgi:hypothetical protein